LGRSAEAARSAERLMEFSQRAENALFASQTALVSARILARAGLADQAVALLETVLAGHSPFSVHTLRVSPFYDPIRHHPRFQALLEKYQSDG
jgi:hypothetical protein